MRTIILKITGFFVVMTMLFPLVSCDEVAFLKEKPLAIYTANTSLRTVTDFQAAVNMLYRRPGEMFFYSTHDGMFSFYHGTDLGYCTAATDRLNTYRATMIPTSPIPGFVWTHSFFMVSQANLILTRLEDSEMTEAERNIIKGEALFFRAFGYRVLANLFGGVPIVTEEITVPRRDFVRETREATYTQVKNDLLEAIPLLGNIDAVKDGKISKQMAQHLISEIYIALGEYDNAISAASAVIDYPAMGLMTQRFGKKADEPGDPYSDLFKTGNQNRSSGNREALWVFQFDYLNPASAGLGNDMWHWKLNPFYQNITVTANGVTTTAFVGVTAEKGGRCIGWMAPTDHVVSGIWEGNEQDMRISEYNIVRDLKIDNQASPAFGKWLVADGYSQSVSRRQWFPFFMRKVTGDIPEDFWQKDAAGNPLLTPLGEHLVTAAGNSTFRDLYLVRLAETYLLRAEAYLGNDNTLDAAADINVIRARANVAPADPSEMDIDYILDERLRELYYEEQRMITLCRLGKLADRNKRYNVSYTDVTGTHECAGTSIEDYHNLWPIPFFEIERNTEAVLQQNPVYAN